MFNKLVLSIALLLAMPLLGQIPVNPPGGGGSGATFTPTGIQYATSATAATVATSLQIQSAIGTGVYSQALKPSQSLQAFGDSYFVGTGVSNPALQSGISLLSAQTPAPAFNYGSSGATAPVVSGFELFPLFIADPFLPSVVLIDGGANDGGGDTCGGTTTSDCAHNYTLTMNGMVGWASIPNQYRLYASQATKSGTWNTDTTQPIYISPTLAAQGTALQNGTTGTLTFTIPSSASPVVGLTYLASNTSSGAFTVTVDGTLRSNLCTGTTSFTNASCGGVAFINYTQAYLRQEWAVTPNQSHTVVVTASSANSVVVLSADWIPPASNANTNAVFVMGPNASFQYSTTYDTLTTSVANQFKTDGLPVFSVSQIDGTPGVNATTDISQVATTSCSASNATGHPNTCGYQHMAQTFQNVAIANNYVFSSYNANENTINGIFTGPISVGAESNLAVGPRAAAFSNFGGDNGANPCTNNAGLGIDWLRGLNNSSGIGWGCDQSTGLPFSGAFVNKTFNSLGWNCMQATPANTLLTTNAETSYTSKWCEQFSSGNTVQLGISSQAIDTVASASTVAITAGITHITGTTPIATITPTNVFTSNTGGCVKLWPDDIFTWVTGGNISNSGTAVVGTPIDACWSGTSWFLK